MDELDLFKRVGLALAIGLLMGVERGWHTREVSAGARVSGIRTFALMGLLGGIVGALSLRVGDILIAAALLAFAALVIVGHALRVRRDEQPDIGITTEVASLLAFALGVVAVRGNMAVAAAAGVIATGLLAIKPALHGWVERIEQYELSAGIKLLIISVVLLPLLPNRGFGPGGALNPYTIWWVVVLVAALSFVGYVAIRIAGAKIGTLAAALFGGLASSTATTVAFAHLGRRNPALRPVLAAGVVGAAATVFPRTLVLVGALNWRMVPDLAWPLATMAAIGYGAALVMARSAARSPDAALETLPNPLELGMALKFGALLAGVLLLAELLRQWIGSGGLYLLAAISGAADVDSATVTMARLARLQHAPAEVAAIAVVVAASVNTLGKIGIVAWIAGGGMARRVAVALAGIVAAGAAATALALAGALPAPPPT